MRYADKSRGLYSCVIIRLKHRVLSYRVITWIQIALYYCTPVRGLLVPKTAYEGLKHPQSLPGKYIPTI